MTQTDGTAALASRLTPATHGAARWLVGCLDRGCQLPPGELERLAVRLEQRLLPGGTAICVPGQTPQGVWGVRSGTLEAVAGSGPRRMVVHVLRAGDLTGDVALLLGRPATSTVRALTDVRAEFLPAAHFSALLADSPVLTRAWLRAMARRHARVCEALSQTVGGSAEGRIARLLLREARDGTVTCSQSTMAAMLGLCRPTVNRVLKEFERQGLLRIGYRQVQLLDEEQLSNPVPRTGSARRSQVSGGETAVQRSFSGR